MSLTPSTMLALGTSAPDFRLPDTRGQIVSLADFKAAPALLVLFICNHCPYVKHIRPALADLGREYQRRGAAIVAINSNDAENYPEDSPEKMKQEVKAAGYVFPYLYDEAQSVPGLIGPPARRIFFFSTRTAGCFIAGSSTTAAPAMAVRSRVGTCARRWTPSWRANRSRNRKPPASAATSSGRRATRPTIFEDDF